MRSGLLWGYVFGIFVASSAWGYRSAYRTPAQRAALAVTFGSNAGVNAIVGTAHQIQTVAGFTAWRSLGVLGVVGAVWGLLTSTRLLRGEEETGRWELLLAGRTTRRGACGQALTGLGAGLAVMWIVASVATAAVGRASSVQFAVDPSLFFGLALIAGAAVFLAVGAVTSQLCATRRQAAQWAGAVLGLSYVLRMVADSGTGATWLRWATPLGWVEELQPLTAPNPVALLPIAGLVCTGVVVAIVLSGRRDLGSSLVADREPRRARASVSAPFGLTFHLMRPQLFGWGLAVGALAVTSGLIAKSAGSAFSSSSLRQALGRLGGAGHGASIYLGVAFVILGALITMAGAGFVASIRSEEADGRLDHLLAGPIGRSAWLAEKGAAAVAALVALGLVAGLFAWFGSASQHAAVGFGRLLEAGLNLAPAGILVVGVGVCTFGVWPRATSIAVYGLVAWSFLVDLIGGIVNANHWLLDTSVFHQLSSAPATAPDWTTAAVLTSLGLALAFVGGGAFIRRDLVGA
jgi:ABC-2 type transport system permease protein